MRFAVQVCEKIKHGTTRSVTVFAPVVSSIIVFKGLRGRGWSCSGVGRRVQGRLRRRQSHGSLLNKNKERKMMESQDGGENTDSLHSEQKQELLLKSFLPCVTLH